MIKYSEISKVKVGDCFWEVIEASDGWMLRKRQVTVAGKKQVVTVPVAWRAIDAETFKLSDESKARGERVVHREWRFKDYEGNRGDRFQPPLFETKREALVYKADELHAQSFKYAELAAADRNDAMFLHKAAYKCNDPLEIHAVDCPMKSGTAMENAPDE
jgi:hypothetical protein